MTYPGTKPRVPSAIESSLISRVTELERERGELVEALRKSVDHYVSLVASGDCGNWNAEDEMEVSTVRTLLAKYPCAK